MGWPSIIWVESSNHHLGGRCLLSDTSILVDPYVINWRDKENRDSYAGKLPSSFIKQRQIYMCYLQYLREVPGRFAIILFDILDKCGWIVDVNGSFWRSHDTQKFTFNTYQPGMRCLDLTAFQKWNPKISEIQETQIPYKLLIYISLYIYISAKCQWI